VADISLKVAAPLIQDMFPQLPARRGDRGGIPRADGWLGRSARPSLAAS